MKKWGGGYSRWDILRRVKKILFPYCIATLVYYVFAFHRFDFEAYFVYLTHFNITGPFYFLLFYMELVIISPILYNIIKYINNKKYKMGILIGMILLSFWLAHIFIYYTEVIDIYGGGKYLFGGTYFVLYLIGMLIGNMKFQIRTRKRKWIHLFASFVVTILWFRFIYKDQLRLDANLWWKEGFNPPGISFMIYALCVVWFGYSIYMLQKEFQWKPLKWIQEQIEKLGKASLYIFLYHRLFLDYLLPYIKLENLMIKRIVYLVVIIGGPILIKKMGEKGKDFIDNFMRGKYIEKIRWEEN